MNADVIIQVLDWARSHYFGKYRGVVSDNSDPTSRGRLKVRVPSVLGELELWAMPCVPYAGKGVGFYSLPEPGTGVWVEFEAGDPSYPVWTGFFWADGELPDSSGAPVKIWKTDSLTIRLDDNADELLIQNTADSKITIGSDVKTESGQSTHAVGSQGVVSEQGIHKVEVTNTSVKVNNGALEVK
ncbi:MAG: phage baseplate assembly protein V [Blastocatellia bacterium]